MFKVGDKVMYAAVDVGMSGVDVFPVGSTGLITGLCGSMNNECGYVLADDPKQRSTIGRDNSNANTWVINVKALGLIPTRHNRKTPGWKAYYNNEKEICI